MDFIVSRWIFTSMPTENSLLTERVCRGREGKACQREVKEEQRPMQRKERARRERSRTRSLLICFLRENGEML